MTDWIVLRDQYSLALPHLEEFAHFAEGLFREQTRQRGVQCEVKVRAKEISSFVKKALRKDYSSPFEDMGDKVGMRIIVPFRDSLPEVERIIEDLCYYEGREDKAEALSFDRLGYLGIHFDRARLRERAAEAAPPSTGATVFEVQLHTRAQNLWSEMEHALVYKPPQTIDTPVRRAMNRLVALMELFDSEITNIRDIVLGQPGYEEAAMLSVLERHFFRLAVDSFDFDRQLSMEILAALRPLLPAEGVADFGGFVAVYVDANERALRQIFAQYEKDTRRNPLLFQPETLLIFERIDHSPFTLGPAWEEILPLTLLENLAEVWGRRL